MILATKPSRDYELLDSGEGEKLERFGAFILSRPDPQALWKKSLSKEEWDKADGIFAREGQNGNWNMRKGALEKWNMEFGGLKFSIKPTAFKHTGLFPEQFGNWEWIKRVIGNCDSKNLEVLNLFGYTGGATLACAQAGAKVTHVDGSRSAVTWAKENAELSGLTDKPIRWILEDARIFVGREIKRGRRYDAIIMDPPAFGHGANKEIWKIEEHFLPLVEDCMKLLSEKPLFFLINGYSAGYSAIAYENCMLGLVEKFGGKIEVGELTIEESKKDGGNEQSSARLLPAGIFARWER